MFYVKYAECLCVNVMNVMKSVYLSVNNALSAKQWRSWKSRKTVKANYVTLLNYATAILLK